MKKILLLPLLFVLFSCAPEVSPEESVLQILDYVEKEDYGALKNMAPLFTRLSTPEIESVRQTLTPYFTSKPYMEVKKQGFKQCSVFLYTQEKESQSIVMTFNNIKGVWVLSENITFKEKIDFIPAEK